MNRPITWNRALRALTVACLLVATVLFVAANFVLVEVRLVGFTVEVRLAWAVVLPASRLRSPAACSTRAPAVLVTTRGPRRVARTRNNSLAGLPSLGLSTAPVGEADAREQPGPRPPGGAQPLRAVCGRCARRGSRSAPQTSRWLTARRASAR